MRYLGVGELLSKLIFERVYVSFFSELGSPLGSFNSGALPYWGPKKGP